MAEAIDVSQLEMMTGGDAELAVEALGIFRQSAELWGRMLDPHAAAEQWADAAHGIKGAARSVGLMALGDACETCEQLGRSGEASPAQAGVAIAADSAAGAPADRALGAWPSLVQPNSTTAEAAVAHAETRVLIIFSSPASAALARAVPA